MKVPKKSVCCYLMMLSYQHDSNIVPGPDTNNFSCLMVQSATEVTTVADLAVL